MAYDLVIRDGTLVDGTGRPAFQGDVAVSGDRIVAVGHVDGHGHETIDAEGRVVSPGFVDVHTHLDAQVAWTRSRRRRAGTASRRSCSATVA